MNNRAVDCQSRLPAGPLERSLFSKDHSRIAGKRHNYLHLEMKTASTARMICATGTRSPQNSDSNNNEKNNINNNNERPSEASPWPPDVDAGDLHHILAGTGSLGVDNLPARVKPDHQETQANKIKVGSRKVKLSNRRFGNERHKTR